MARDSDYSPAYQDEYRRLWHRAAEERDAWKRHAQTSDKEVAELRGLARAFLIAYHQASQADEEGLASREDWRGAWNRCDAAAQVLEKALDPGGVST